MIIYNKFNEYLPSKLENICICIYNRPYLRARSWNLTKMDFVKTAVDEEETDFSSTWAKSSWRTSPYQ